MLELRVFQVVADIHATGDATKAIEQAVGDGMEFGGIQPARNDPPRYVVECGYILNRSDIRFDPPHDRKWAESAVRRVERACPSAVAVTLEARGLPGEEKADAE